ncbi:hybrid sensor histidine kinase/response regulator [Caulobacter vibrioides]|uniref:histidine kinase n=1 Tax=Caulobacter vibrioides TaxID=155892 RepID=A0A290MPS9_CAUVI|nr:ATP-binding protein [Caulobacter vibrioides]ATC30903.1 hybrid sensor histidine kinase/response regulator [Caulobacter vibrioides]
MARPLLDDSIDLIASTGRQARPARLGMAVLVAGFLGFNLGAAIAVAWFAAAMVAEVYALGVTQLSRRLNLSPMLRRLGYVTAVIVMVGAWTALTIVLWTSANPALQWAAICLAAGQLIHAQSVTFRAPTLFAIDVGMPATSLIVMPILTGGFSPVQIATMMTAVGLMLLYTFTSAAANNRRMIALEAAEAQALKASEAKSAFLAMISHEIRTPMNGVLAMADALSRAQLDPAQARQTALLKRSGEDLMTLLNDVLDISRIEAGKLEIERQPFDLPELLGDLRALWATAATDKGLDLLLTIAPGLAERRLGDPNRLRQILCNLVSNAVKFTPSGQVALRALPGQTPETVVFEVADTGIGLTPEQSARLFQSFSQADASIARRFGGSGLGLSICSQLAALMDGAITVESAPGAGSTFRLTLPLPGQAPAAAAIDAPTAVAPTAVATPELANLAGLRVLVADDHPVNQAVARAILEAGGARVVIADNGEAALASLNTAPADLVLLDLRMPVLDGRETARRIRRGEAGDPAVPIIALTGEALADDPARWRADGFDAVQQKPVVARDLLAAAARLTARTA